MKVLFFFLSAFVANDAIAILSESEAIIRSTQLANANQFLHNCAQPVEANLFVARWTIRPTRAHAVAVAVATANDIVAIVRDASCRVANANLRFHQAQISSQELNHACGYFDRILFEQTTRSALWLSDLSSDQKTQMRFFLSAMVEVVKPRFCQISRNNLPEKPENPNDSPAAGEIKAAF